MGGLPPVTLCDLCPYHFTIILRVIAILGQILIQAKELNSHLLLSHYFVGLIKMRFYVLKMVIAVWPAECLSVSGPINGNAIADKCVLRITRQRTGYSVENGFPLHIFHGSN